jgi:uroporphyrinogen decarboxylase
MPQTPREVVTRAIEFRRPDRLPLLFEALGMNDTYSVGGNFTGTGDRALKETLDDWGCTWRRSEMANMGQVKGHPLADESAFASYRWPDFDDPKFYDGIERKLDGAGDKYVVTGIFMLLFERMHTLRGFENLLTDLYLERERTEKLADRIVESQLAIISNIGRRVGRRIQGLSFTDDWGTEQALFVSPGLWRDFFKPRYKRLFDAMHEQGWHVWMHSCGKVNEIVGDLAEVGANVVNLQQPRALGIEEMGRRYAGKICFSSLCDIQATLPFKGREEIRAEAKLLLDRWATPDGGFILADYGDGQAIGVPDEKKRIMLDAFLEFDRWKKGGKNRR